MSKCNQDMKNGLYLLQSEDLIDTRPLYRAPALLLLEFNLNTLHHIDRVGVALEQDLEAHGFYELLSSRSNCYIQLLFSDN